jgi:cysteinyl-tRNA synthetase
MDGVLGLDLAKEAAARDEAEDPSFATEIEKLIEERNEAKAAKNYKRADEIRQVLKERGISLEDSPGGTTWKRF